MKTGTALGGLRIVADRRGATYYPPVRRVTRRDSAVTRFGGAFLKGRAREFWAPEGAASVTGRQRFEHPLWQSPVLAVWHLTPGP